MHTGTDISIRKFKYKDNYKPNFVSSVITLKIVDIFEQKFVPRPRKPQKVCQKLFKFNMFGDPAMGQKNLKYHIEQIVVCVNNI